MSASYNAVSTSTTAVNILAPNNGRRGLLIKNNGGVIVYIGFDNAVTSSTGLPLLPQDSFTLTGEHGVWKGAVWGITASGSTDCRYWDWTP